jgi:CBS domain-containing protein
MVVGSIENTRNIAKMSSPFTMVDTKMSTEDVEDAGASDSLFMKLCSTKINEACEEDMQDAAYTVYDTDTLEDVFDTLVDQDVACLPVVNTQGYYQG